MAGLPESIHKLINEALEIEAEQAKAAGSLGFMCRSMVQASLPSRRVDGFEFVRSNGNFTLSLMSPSKIGLPVGASIRVEDAIYALVTKSANDIAVAASMTMATRQHWSTRESLIRLISGGIPSHRIRQACGSPQ